MKLAVFIEKNGKKKRVGHISGKSYRDAFFSYDEDYIKRSDSLPISISMPLENVSFSPERTRNFFDGLLPEGFTRREVVRHIHVNDDDYISILRDLGRECLGAIQVKDADTLTSENTDYTQSKAEDCLEDRYEKVEDSMIVQLASEGASKAADIMTGTHLSLAGASGKIGMYFDKKEKKWYLPHGDAPSTHIIKQSHVRLNSLVINEYMVMLTAAYLGIETADCNVINLGSGNDQEILFVTKRYDRVIDETSRMIQGHPRPFRLHQEDFSQAFGIRSDEKYEKNENGYLKRMFDIVRSSSSNPINDQLELWGRCVFNYIIGNTDAHIKNFSLLYDKDMRTIRLSPAYDMISTLIYDESTREMSFYIGGENNCDRIDRDCFERAAKEAGIGKKMAMQRLEMIQKNVGTALKKARDRMIKEGLVVAEEVYEKVYKTLRIW